jgi:hypothetical protein
MRLAATIPCDWGYAFDYLSIFHVKIEKKKDDESKTNFSETSQHLIKLLGTKGFYNVYKSHEYQRLYDVNARLFDLVDLAKKDEVKASEVDAGVWERYLAKKALQERFFPNVPLAEQKFGYK